MFLLGTAGGFFKLQVQARLIVAALRDNPLTTLGVMLGVPVGDSTMPEYEVLSGLLNKPFMTVGIHECGPPGYVLFICGILSWGCAIWSLLSVFDVGRRCYSRSCRRRNHVVIDDAWVFEYRALWFRVHLQGGLALNFDPRQLEVEYTEPYDTHALHVGLLQPM